MNGIVFDIAAACFHDGAGIRTTVFLKGCRLSCLWCHNPESKKTAPQLFYKDFRCAGCLQCASVCQNGVHTFKNISENPKYHNVDFEKCVLCGKCVSVCKNNALSVIGKSMSVADVMNEVLKDKAFYDTSGGGLTLSGGEPLGSQVEFALELLKAAKTYGINTAVETSGFAEKVNFQKVAPFVDYFLFDYKVSPELYPKYTGGNFSVIKENLSLLNSLNAHIILRCPVISKINDNDDHLLSIAELIREYPSIKSVQLLPYNTFGVGKYKSIGETAPLTEPIGEKDSFVRFTENLRGAVNIPVVD